MIETPGAAARRRHDRPRAAVSRPLQAEASIIWNPQRRPSGKTCSSLLLPRSMGRAGESDSHWRPRCEPGRRARSRGRARRCVREGWRFPSLTAGREPSPTARCPRYRRKPSWRWQQSPDPHLRWPGESGREPSRAASRSGRETQNRLWPSRASFALSTPPITIFGLFPAKVECSWIGWAIAPTTKSAGLMTPSRAICFDILLMIRLLSWLVPALTYSWSRSDSGAHAAGANGRLFPARTSGRWS